MERRKAREAVLELLFEHEFKKDDDPVATVRLAEHARDLEIDSYVEKVYLGVLQNTEKLDEIISSKAIGWKTNRMTKLSLSILRIAVYEMTECDDVPFSVAINEAVELAKKFDDEKAPPFINGILNAAAEQLGLKG